MSAATTSKSDQKGEKLRAYHEEAELGRAYDVVLLKRLYPFVKPHGRWMLLSLGMLLVMTGLSLVRPLAMGEVVKHAKKETADQMLRDGVMLAAVVLFGQAFSFVQTYTMQVAGARSMAGLREFVFRRLQALRLSYYDKTPVGRLVTRATNDVDALGELFVSGVLNALGDLLQLVGIVVLMLSLDARLAVVAFVTLPVVGLVVNYVRKRSRIAYREIRARTARLNAFLNEQVAGIAVVQAYAKEEAVARDFDVINSKYRDSNKESVFYEAVLDAAIEMVSTLCLASILFWAARARFSAWAVTFPLVVTFVQYTRQFFEPVSLLAQRYTVLQSAMSGAERIFQLLDDAPSDLGKVEDADCAPDGPPEEAVFFDHVTFGYKEGNPILKDASLLVRRGEKIALVGATGAGKTTVTSLLLRLYEHQEGTIRVLGKDIRSYDPPALREEFAVVLQDVFLFAGTVLSNVAMSDPHPSEEKARSALERIGAWELFEGRGGLQASVDERGANFSSGERQLLAFARALYRDAPILILDEATANIDSETESRLQKALGAAIEGRTAIMVAHRLSTIRKVDRIVVFHKGRIVEQGTHDELVRENGIYARLYRLQFAKQEADKTAEFGPTKPAA